ncbi:rCG52013 [Rattus norvegicus]|uniref:RCG52013 n=1 Tax=Rattus norvegicus TaxID=10116 RepID=A6K350_RAT|nr:rCG52013 [Rattus norvegicus]
MSHTGTLEHFADTQSQVVYCLLCLSCLTKHYHVHYQVEFLCPSFPWLMWVGGSRSDGSCLRSGVGRTLASFCVYNWICDSSCESLSSTFLL